MPRDRHWPLEPPANHEAVLQVVREAAGGGLHALVRCILVERPGDGAWRPCIVRVDLARRGDLPPAEPDDFGQVRVLAEELSGTEFLARLEAALRGDPFRCGTDLVENLGLGSRWHRTRHFPAQDRWANWPCTRLEVPIPDHPPYVPGLFVSRTTKKCFKLDSLIGDAVGLTGFAWSGDARHHNTHIVVWDYRGRLIDSCLRPGGLFVVVEPRHDASLRLLAASEGWTPNAIDAPAAERFSVPATSTKATVQLVAGEEVVDQAQPHLVPPRLTDDEQGTPVLPNGDLLPEGDEAAILATFAVRSPGWRRAVGRSALAKSLTTALRRPVHEHEVEAAIQGLIDRALLDHAPNPGPAIKMPKLLELPGLPPVPKVRSSADPDPDEVCYSSTYLGRKAAQACVARRAPTQAYWRLGHARLAEQLLVAVEHYPFIEQLDAVCCTAHRAEVEVALAELVAAGDLTEEDGRYSHTPSGLGKKFPIEAELAELSKAAGDGAAPEAEAGTAGERGNDGDVHPPPTTEALVEAPLDERQFMELAVKVARDSVAEDGRVHPMVGAVAVRAGQVLGTAHRGETGRGDHAEFGLLEKKLASGSLAGATVYATLEPCTTRSHPKVPCVERIIERKVARVVIGMLDPNDEIRGKGVLRLRRANIEVQLFPKDLADQLEELNREFGRQHLLRPGPALPWRWILAAGLVVGAALLSALYWSRRDTADAPTPTPTSRSAVRTTGRPSPTRLTPSPVEQAPATSRHRGRIDVVVRRSDLLLTARQVLWADGRVTLANKYNLRPPEAPPNSNEYTYTLPFPQGVYYLRIQRHDHGSSRPPWRNLTMPSWEVLETIVELPNGSSWLATWDADQHFANRGQSPTNTMTTVVIGAESGSSRCAGTVALFSDRKLPGICVVDRSPTTIDSTALTLGPNAATQSIDLMSEIVPGAPEVR